MSPAQKENIRSIERRLILASAIGFLVFLGLSVIFTNIYLSGKADETAMVLNQIIRAHEMRLVTEVLEQARAKNFRLVRFQSPEDRLEFTLPEIAALKPDTSLWHSISNGRITVSTVAANSSSGRSELIFEYNKFLFAPEASLLWFAFFLVSIAPMRVTRRRLVEQFNKDLKAQEESLRADLARKVRHNIRTPLAALIRLSDTVTGLRRSDSELFQSIIGQIRFLVSELDIAKPKLEISEKVPLFDCIQDSFREQKLVTDSNIELECSIDDAVSSAQVQFVYHELRSIIANLCANSREAIELNGTIKLSAEDLGNEIVISIEDNGRGIDPEILPRLTEKGFSVGKKDGSGLGLYHAKESLAAWSGRLKIQSEVGEGTVVKLRLPILNRESWYVPRVKLAANDAVVVVDDQVSIHRLWQIRLDEAGFIGKRYFYFSGKESANCTECAALNVSTTHVFMDQDLGEGEPCGLDVLESQFRATQRYLVTGNFDQLEIRAACDSRDIALIAKTELPGLPIVVQLHC